MAKCDFHGTVIGIEFMEMKDYFFGGFFPCIFLHIRETGGREIRKIKLSIKEWEGTIKNHIWDGTKEGAEKLDKSLFGKFFSFFTGIE